MEIYDGICILKPNLSLENIQTILDGINYIFSRRDCELVRLENWGMKSLVYEIEGFTVGRYIKFIANADREAVAEFDVFCIENDDLLRHILMKK